MTRAPVAGRSAASANGAAVALLDRSWAVLSDMVSDLRGLWPEVQCSPVPAHVGETRPESRDRPASGAHAPAGGATPSCRPGPTLQALARAAANLERSQTSQGAWPRG